MTLGLYIALALFILASGSLFWDYTRQKAKEAPKNEQTPEIVPTLPGVQTTSEDLSRFPAIKTNEPGLATPTPEPVVTELPPVERVVVRRLDTPVMRELQQLIGVWENRINTIPYGSSKEASGYRDAVQECRDDLMGTISDLEQMKEE